MKRIIFGLATALILAALTIALPKFKSNVQANPVANPVISPAAPQLGPNACKGVKFIFTNNRLHSEQIQAKKVEFKLSGRDGWFSEDVAFADIPNVDKGQCPNGFQCSTKGDNLNQASGRDVLKVKLYYWYKGQRSTDNWSDLTPSREFDVDKSQQRCKDGNGYGPFVIGQQ